MSMRTPGTARSTSTSCLSGSALAMRWYVARSGTTSRPYRFFGIAVVAQARSSATAMRLMQRFMANYCTAHGARHLLLDLADGSGRHDAGRADDVRQLLR